MASHWYATGLHAILSNGMAGLVDPKLMLVRETYTPLKSHTVRADLGATELSVAGYTAGGQGVRVAAMNDAGNSRIEINIESDSESQSLVFSSLAAGQNIRYAVLYDDDGATDKLLAVFDRGSNLPTNGEDVTITFDWTDGNLRVTY